jgi:hypothetical protein
MPELDQSSRDQPKPPKGDKDQSFIYLDTKPPEVDQSYHSFPSLKSIPHMSY